MASLDSYIKDRNERLEKGTLVYNGTKKVNTTSRIDFNRLNEKTFKQNNGAWHDRTKFYF